MDSDIVFFPFWSSRFYFNFLSYFLFSWKSHVIFPEKRRRKRGHFPLPPLPPPPFLRAAAREASPQELPKSPRVTCCLRSFCSKMLQAHLHILKQKKSGKRNVLRVQIYAKKASSCLVWTLFLGLSTLLPHKSSRLQKVFPSSIFWVKKNEIYSQICIRGAENVDAISLFVGGEVEMRQIPPPPLFFWELCWEVI